MPKNILIHQTTVKKTSYLCPKLKKTNGKRSPHGAVAHFSRDTIINSHRAIWQNFIFSDMKKLLLMTVLGFLGMTGAAAQSESGGMVAGVKNLPAKHISVSSDLRASDVSFWNLAEAAEEYAGGSGTEADPYQIATVGQLMKLCVDSQGDLEAAEPGDYPIVMEGVYFKQTADIDLSGAYSNDIEIARHAYFAGHYDGNGFAIKGYKVLLDNPELEPTYIYSQALFAQLFQATVKNVKMVDAEMDLNLSGIENNQLMFAFLAYQVIYSTIENCSVNGVLNANVSGDAMTNLFTAGLALVTQEASLINCHTEGSITANIKVEKDSEKSYGNNISDAGGVLNTAYGDSRIVNCTNKMSITNTAEDNSTSGLIVRSGGLLCFSDSATIEYSCNTGDIHSSGSSVADDDEVVVYTGGLIGACQYAHGVRSWSACEMSATKNQKKETVGLVGASIDYLMESSCFDAELVGEEINNVTAVTTEFLQSEEYIKITTDPTRDDVLQWQYVEGSYPILGEISSDPTASESISKSEISFRTVPGAVVITAPEATPFAAYTFTGAMQATQLIPAGTTTVNLPAGLYILKIGEETHKVNMK